MISKILVAVDGSSAAGKAVEYAVGLAKQTGATVTFLSVIDMSAFTVQSVPDVVAPTHLTEPIEDYLKQAAEAHIEEAVKLCSKNNVRSKKAVRSGHPVEEIIKEADASKSDLIIMGSHGKSAVRAAILGSVTYGVIHKETKVPVLIVRRG